MTDSTNKQRMIVSTDGGAGPYILVPADQLDAVRSMLSANDVSFWVDSNVISLNGRPAIAFINLGRRVDAGQVQLLLDAIE